MRGRLVGDCKLLTAEGAALAGGPSAATGALVIVLNTSRGAWWEVEVEETGDRGFVAAQLVSVLGGGDASEDEQARQRYRLETFASREAAGEAGAHVTHLTPCDLCSSLEDLAAYMSHWDMTAPGRACGLQGTISRELGLQCFAELGLTPPCAAIWLDNADHTRAVCLLPCLIHLNSPYNREDGSLNDCLQCDEDESGPIFQQVARRTRRNSGMGSAIWRPPDTIANVTHDYY